VGSVVGEKIAHAIRFAIAERQPLLILSASGGMRMQEGTLSLMQMAKTSALLTKLAEARLPFISLLTDPTTGGTSASFAMLGDVILAEPGALIGFAGPRVIKQTIGEDLPEGFQRAEFLLEHGFVDQVVPRAELKTTLHRLFSHLLNQTPTELEPVDADESLAE
jgi:acetyl-CoA carboxylase carboxyl transferase subunit beta